MRGSLHCQVEGLFHCAAKGIGESRHEIKKRKELDTKIHADNTRATYLGVWHRIIDHAHRQYQLYIVENLSAEMVASWLEEQVDKGLAPATIATYYAAITKLQHALNELNKLNKMKGEDHHGI